MRRFALAMHSLPAILVKCKNTVCHSLMPFFSILSHKLSHMSAQTTNLPNIARRIRDVARMLSSTRYLVRRLQTQFVIETTKDKSFPVLLDIGAGSSPYKKNIKHSRYVAVDVEDRGGGGEVIRGDLTKGVPLPDATADIILCTEVLEHLPEHGKAMSELFRLLKPGGVLIVTVPFVWVLHEAPNDFYRFTNYGLQHLLVAAGFANIQVEASNNSIYTILQLLVIPLRHPFFVPLVTLVNLLGYVVGKFPSTETLPLNQHARALKPQT